MTQPIKIASAPGIKRDGMLKRMLIAGILLIPGCAGLPSTPGFAGGRLLPHEIVTAPVGEYFTLNRRRMAGIKCPEGYWMYSEIHVGIYKSICLPRSAMDAIYRN